MKKRIIAILTTVALLGGTCIYTESLAAKKPTLNKKKITLKVGQKKTLKLKNYKKKVKWSSSKKKIATVSKKGVVTAKKKGTAKITAKAGKKKYVCKVTVKAKTSNKTLVTQAPVTTVNVGENVSSTSATSVSASTPPTTTIQPTATPVGTIVPTQTPSGTPHPNAGQVIYDLAQETGVNPETGESWGPPITSDYSYFKYESFKIWLCRALLYNPQKAWDTISTPGQLQSEDYRGVELEYTITLKNSGNNDLPELAFCLNQTSGADIAGEEAAYPYMFHVVDKVVSENRGGEWNMETIKSDARHKSATVVENEIKAGQTYTYRFKYTMPADAMNDDKDPNTGVNYPIMMYISNHKDGGLYQTGDQIIVYDCKIKISDGTPITTPVEEVEEPAGVQKSESDVNV